MADAGNIPPRSTRISARALAKAKAAADAIRRLGVGEVDAAGLQVLRVEVMLQRAARQQRVRCGARTRRGTACLRRTEPGRTRCRNHGGLSTGPTSPEGLRRVGEAARLRMISWWR